MIDIVKAKRYESSGYINAKAIQYYLDKRKLMENLFLAELVKKNLKTRNDREVNVKCLPCEGLPREIRRKAKRI